MIRVNISDYREVLVRSYYHDNSVIRLKVEDRDQLALVSLDSRSRAFDSSLELIIKKADFKINLIEPKDNSFISTIRNKLMWGSDKRN